MSLIIIGTFLRGPGWNWFWPWQDWDPHKVEAMTNVDLPYLFGFRDYFWSAVFGWCLVDHATSWSARSAMYCVGRSG